MDPESHTLDLVFRICTSDVIPYICELGRSLCATDMCPSAQLFSLELELPHSVTLLDVQASFFILSHSQKQVFLMGHWFLLSENGCTSQDLNSVCPLCHKQHFPSVNLRRRTCFFFLRSSVQHCFLTPLFRAEVGEEMYPCNTYALKSFPTCFMKDNGFAIYVHKWDRQKSNN